MHGVKERTSTPQQIHRLTNQKCCFVSRTVCQSTKCKSFALPVVLTLDERNGNLKLSLFLAPTWHKYFVCVNERVVKYWFPQVLAWNDFTICKITASKLTVQAHSCVVRWLLLEPGQNLYMHKISIKFPSGSFHLFLFQQSSIEVQSHFIGQYARI